MNIEKFIDNDITKEEALELTNLKGKNLIKLFSVANEIREKFCGNKIRNLSYIFSLNNN